MFETFTMPLQHSTAEQSITWFPTERDQMQACHNHGGQTLERLKERGGMSWCELAAILEGRAWRKMDQGARAAVWTELKRRQL